MTDVNSITIRDAIFALLSGMPGLFTKTRATMDTLIDADLPALAVFVIRDEAKAFEMGAGEPSFLHELSIGVGVRDAADGSDDLAAKLSAWATAIKATVLGASDNDAPPTTGATGAGVALASQIEGFIGFAETQMTASRDGDRYFGDARFEFRVQYRSYWPPLVPDDFSGLQVAVAPGGDASAVNVQIINVPVS